MHNTSWSIAGRLDASRITPVTHRDLFEAMKLWFELVKGRQSNKGSMRLCAAALLSPTGLRCFKKVSEARIQSARKQ
jgi:hypothetical protein